MAHNDHSTEWIILIPQCLNMPLRSGIFFVVVSCLLGDAYAATPGELENPLLISESEYFSDVPSISTVTRLPQPRADTPAAVTVIDRDMIFASGARRLADVLRLVPGFQVAYPREHRPTATYHGLGDEYARRMQILIDGRSVYSAFFSHVTWSDQAVAIDDIERIEVIRGPNAAAYGANAFLATINIITRHSSRQNGTRVNLAFGEQATEDLALSYGDRVTNGDYRIGAGSTSGEGLSDIPDDYTTLYINTRFDLNWNNSDSLSLQAGLSETTAQEGDEDEVLFPPVTSKRNRSFLHLKWLRQVSIDSELRLQVYANRAEFDLSYVTAPIDFGPGFGLLNYPANYDYQEASEDIELQHELRLSVDTRLVWGAGFRQDKVESLTWLGHDQSVLFQSSRLFANLELKLAQQTIVNLGIMAEQTELIEDFLSPRIAVNHHLDDRHTLRAAVSRAQRLPSILEENSQLNVELNGIVIDQIHQASGQLDAEIMDSVEFGYLAELPETHMQLDLRLYRDRIDDLITEFYVPAADLSNGEAIDAWNEGEFIVDGIDLEFNYQPTLHDRLRFTLSFMEVSGTELSANATTSEQNRLESAPSHSGSLLIMHRFNPAWSGSLAYYFVDSMNWMGQRRRLEGFDRLDLRLARQLRFGRSKGELSFVVQNLGDDYQEYTPDISFTQRALVALRLNL